MTNRSQTSSLNLQNAILLLTILMLFPSAASGQCTLKQNQLPAAPELLGFHLGMTKEEVKARVPQTVFGKTDSFGVSKTTINPYFDPKIDKTKFENVRSVSLDLLDEHVTSIWIGFDEDFKATTVDDFVKLISGSLNISSTWSDWKSRGRQIRCADFQLIVTTVARGPSFRILDSAADETIAARRLAKEEKQEGFEAGKTEGDAEAEEITGDNVTKTYFPVGCEASKHIAKDHRVSFKTPAEAEKAGFKLSNECH